MRPTGGLREGLDEEGCALSSPAHLARGWFPSTAGLELCVGHVLRIPKLASPPLPRPISFHPSSFSAEHRSPSICRIDVSGGGAATETFRSPAKYHRQPPGNLPSLWHVLLKSIKCLHKHLRLPSCRRHAFLSHWVDGVTRPKGLGGGRKSAARGPSSALPAKPQEVGGEVAHGSLGRRTVSCGSSSSATL